MKFYVSELLTSTFFIFALLVLIFPGLQHMKTNLQQNPATDRYTEKLYTAIYQGDLDKIQLLLEKGAKLNVKLDYREGQSPLSYAIESGQEEVFHYLAAQGGDLNIRSDVSETILHKAAGSGSLSMINHLLKQGANLNSQDDYGRTPLFEAVRYRHLEAVKLLVKQGADIHAVSNEGENLLHEAVIQRYYPAHQELVDYLLTQGVDVNGLDKRGNSVLLETMMHGKPEIIRSLLEADANINQQSQYGVTALMMAVGASRFKIAELLLDYSADPDLLDQSGAKAIDRFSAYNKNHALYLRLAEITQLSPDQQFLRDIKQLDYTAIQKRLKNGVDLNRKTSDASNTALHWAIQFGDLKIIKMFVEADADLNIQNDSGYSALHQAVIAYPMAHSPDPKRAEQVNEILHYLLSFPDRINPNLRHFNGETAIFDASKRRLDLDIIQQIINLGADLTLTDSIGAAVIHEAAQQGNLELVKMLLEAGADINAKTTWDYTPLSLAAYDGHIEVVRYLLAQGADPSIATRDGVKPWRRAQKRGHWKIVKLLWLN